MALIEATGATIGPVARAAGFALDAASCGTGWSEPDGRLQAVLYEMAADQFAARYPRHVAAHDEECVDLWVEWYPESGRLLVNMPGGFTDVRGLEAAGRTDLVPSASSPVMTVEDLDDPLNAYAEGLDHWLEEGRPSESHLR